MANKNFNKILIVIVILLVFNLIRTYAYNINSDNNPGVIVGPGGSGEAGDATNWQGNTRAIRIRVFRDGKETSYSKYYLLKNLENNCNIKQISGKICTTSGYNYSSVNNTDGSTCTDGSVSLGCLVSEGLESTWERLSSNGNVLKTYLENDNYSNLREILAQLGYNDSTFKENDIAIVEPVTYVLCANEVYFGTSTALMKQNVSYRGTSGNKCAAADNDYSKPKDGIADGNTFINVYRSMSIALKDTENNWSTNSEGKTTSTQNTNYSGFGYFKYDLSNFYSPTYKVVYHGNGGTWNGTDQWTSDPIEYNSQYAIEPNFFTRNGYAFLGWTTNSNGTDDGIGWTGWSGTWTYKNGEYGINNNELHLYARWITINGNLEITKTNSSTGGALSGVGFTLYSDSACSVVTASEKKTDSNGKVTFSNIQEGTYYYKETTIPKNYAGNTACNYVYVTAGNTNSITVTNDPYYQVKIKKVNSSGEGVINKTVNFNIYTNSGCSGDAFQSLVCHTGGDGTCLVNLPPNNNYWLKETSIDATDFVVTDDCISFGPLSSSRVNTISFTNKTKCEEDFSNNRSIVNRIKLYKTYGYRNLLNFNITKMADACSDYTPSYGRQTSCLFSNQVNSNTEEKFTDENLSDYNDSITGNSGSISYCLTDFELNRNLDIDIDGPVKAGQMLINIGGTRSLATGTIKKTCYIHNNDINKYNIVSTTPTTNFSSFNTLKNLNNGKNYSISNSDLNIYSNYFYSKYTVLHDQKNINYYIPTRELKDYTTKDFLNGCYTKGNQIFISTIKLVSEGNVCYNVPKDIANNYKSSTSSNKIIKLNGITYIKFQDKSTLKYYYVDETDLENYALYNGKLVHSKYLRDTIYQSFKTSFIQYDNYVNSVEVDGKQLIASTPEYANFKVERTENFYKVTGEAIVEYYPNPVYVYKINGTVCNGASSDCIFVGYGLISKFNDAKLPQPSFKFSISSNNNKVIKNSSSTCKYTVEPEIIKYPNSNGNLDLEFRSIDTNCPFPTRDTNSNWCLNGDCASNNALVTSVIKDRNNSYNKTGGNPKYKITLTPSDVLLIRKFNKEISYDNYEIYCDNNGNCSNAFVYDLKSGSINKYENNKIIKNYGSLVYKLET